MNLTCPACGAPFSADDVHVAEGIANCRVCRGVLDLRARDRPLQRPRPPRFSVDDSDGRLTIAWRWFRLDRLGLLVFAIIWWSGLVFGVAGKWTGSVPLPLYLFGMVGCAMIYSGLAGVVNRTRLAIDADLLTVEHGPLPWRGNRKLVRGTLVQLFCRRDTGNKGAISYALVAIDITGTRIDVLRGLPDEGDAKWLEEALERRLGIANRPVVGEVA